MKECSREKVLKGEKSQNDPPYPSRLTGGQQGQGHGVVQHVQGEGYQFLFVNLTHPSPDLN